MDGWRGCRNHRTRRLPQRRARSAARHRTQHPILMHAMRPGIPAALAVLAVVNSPLAHALDCAKASAPVERLICATPKLKQADDAMSAAYAKLLQATAD